MLQKNGSVESATRPTQSTTTEVLEEVNVLVTGFGPFRDAPLSNPSTRIAESLPRVLPQSIAHPTRTNIFVRPEPVPVSYEAVNGLVPAMLEEWTKYHVVLHLGLAAERTWYSLEMSAHSDGYTMQDVEGVCGRPELQPQHWALCPAQLQSSMSAQDVLHRWQSEAEGLDVRISYDAGRYLCEYLYYSSLAFLHVCGNDGVSPQDRITVALLHVPRGAEPKDIATGKRVTMALISAMVDSRRHDNGEGDDA